MPTQVNRRNTLYGYPNPQAGLQQEPIVQARDPLTSDTAELGTIWVNTVSQAYFILTSSSAGVNVWQTATAGATNLASLTVNPGNITVTAGDVDITAGNLNMAPASTATLGNLVAGATTIVGAVGITGNTAIGGDLAVTGNVTVTGDFDITDTASVSITSTNNAAGAITLLTNGGANETLVLQSAQGTGDGAIFLDAIAGGVDISGGKASANAINMHATDAAGGMTVAVGTGGITLGATNGAIALNSGTGAINVGTDAVQHTVTIGNGTGATSVVINAGTGALNIGTNAIAHPITIGNNTGATAVSIQAGTAGAGAINIGTSANAVPITIGNVTGATGITQHVGAGNFVLDGVAASTYAIGASTVGGTITIGGNAQTGNLVIAPSTAVQTIAIANGAASKTINIGNGIDGNVISVGNGANTGAQQINIASGATGANSTVDILNGNGTAGTQTCNILGGTRAGAVNIGAGAAAHQITIGNANAGNLTTLASPITALPGPVYIYTGAGAPGNGLALHVGDLYINTTAASAVTRMYIATGVGAWTNVTCAA